MEEKGEIKKVKDLEISNSEFSNLVDEWVRGERDRAIMKRRYIDRVPFEPLGEEFNLSTQRVKKIVYENEKRIFRHIK